MLVPGATLTLHLLVGSSGTSTSMESTWGLRMVDTGRAPGGAAPGENSKCLGRNP